MRAEDRKIFDFIGSTDNVFDIPPYQRTYHWEKENIKKLINDVEEYVMLKDNGNLELRDYYFGNIIAKRNNDSSITLVDEQQRVTTSILIAKSLHKLLDQKLKKEKIDKYNDFLSELKKVYFYYDGNNLKIKLNNLENNHKLESILKDSTIEDDSNYYKNYKYLIDYFKGKNYEELINYVKAFKRLNCAIIFLENFDNENLVFESINSKGKKLQQSDLIKNYIFSITEDKDIYHFYNNVFLKNSKNYKEEMEFYRLFDASVNEKSPESLNGTKIYESFKKRYRKSDEKSIFDKTDLEELKEFMAVYKYCLSLDINEASSYISKCAFTTYFPWIYNILFPRNIDNQVCPLIEYNKENDEKYEIFINNENKKILKDNLRLIATYDIKRIFAGYGRAESAKSIPLIEHRIRSWYVNELKIDKNIQNISVKEKCNFFLKHYNERAFQIPKEDFKNKIQNFNIYSEKARVKALLWIYENYFRESVQKIEWNNFKKLEIEHILPQKADREEKWCNYLGKEDLEYLLNYKNDVIGNLTILESEINAKESNLFFKDKFEDYKKSYYVINRKISEYNDWRKEEIDNRLLEIYNFLVSNVIYDN